MATWTFRTPVVAEGPASWSDPLFMRVKLNRGITILLASGTYRAVRYPSQDEIASATAAYMGGHEYAVDDTTRAALIAAGVGVTTDNFSVVPGSLIDLTASPAVQWDQLTLTQNTSPQAVAFDATGYVYVTQVIQDGVQLPGEGAPVPYATRESSGDIAINRLAWDGTAAGVMYVRGAGHGAGIAVEPGSNRLWIDADASGSGFARALSRVTFTDAAVLDSDDTELFRPFGAASVSHGLSCSIDPYLRRFSIRRTFPDPDDGHGRRYYLYDLDAAMAGDFTAPLATVDQRANDGVTANSIGTFQGHQTYGEYVYAIDGDPNGRNTYITAVNWSTGTTERRQYISALPGLQYREPEGLAVWAPDGSRRLAFGFSGGTDNARTYSLLYLPAARTTSLAAGTYGEGGYGEGGYGQ